MAKKTSKKYNHHHVLWERKRWLYSDDWVASELARHFVVTLPIRFHDELHEKLKPIPRPSHKVLLKIYNEFHPTNNVYDDIETLIQLASKHRATRMAAALREELKFIKKRR